MQNVRPIGAGRPPAGVDPSILPAQFSPSGLATDLMRRVLEIAQVAGPEELHHIAWRATQMTNDLCFAAGRAGSGSTKRYTRPDAA